MHCLCVKQNVPALLVVHSGDSVADAYLLVDSRDIIDWQAGLTASSPAAEGPSVLLGW
jgi:hypothetical protein